MLGRFLFRWRGVIGVLAFGVVFWLARPTLRSCVLGVPFLIVGLAVRFWASGYMGIEGRVREIGGRREERGGKSEEGGRRNENGGAWPTRIVIGPYQLLRHPLYVGNLLLVVGMLVAMKPAVWVSAVVLVGFVVEYALIVVAEEAHLAGRGGNADCRMQTAKGKMEDREAGGRSQKSEGRNQKAEVQTDHPSPESMVQSQESFLVSRALCEWRTWMVTGVAWGLALLRALV